MTRHDIKPESEVAISKIRIALIRFFKDMSCYGVSSQLRVNEAVNLFEKEKKQIES
jgi:hypothetical protein